MTIQDYTITKVQIALFPKDFALSDNYVFFSKIRDVFSDLDFSNPMILPNIPTPPKNLALISAFSKDQSKEIQITSGKINFMWHNKGLEETFDVSYEELEKTLEKAFKLMGTKKINRLGHIVDIVVPREDFENKFASLLFTKNTTKNLIDFTTTFTYSDQYSKNTDINHLLKVDTRGILTRSVEGKEVDDSVLLLQGDINTRQGDNNVLDADLAEAKAILKFLADKNSNVKGFERIK